MPPEFEELLDDEALSELPWLPTEAVTEDECPIDCTCIFCIPGA